MAKNKNAFETAYALPQGKYVTPQTAKANGGNALLVRMCNTAKTNATSLYPIIGTRALGPCTGIAIRNKKTKDLLIGHNVMLSVHEYKKFVAQVRKNDDEQLEIHIIGAQVNKRDPADFSLWKEGLEQLVIAIAQTPNATIKTFDVGNKPHPSDFAVDARNGRLIRGTPDIEANVPKAELKEYIQNLEHFMNEWDCLDEDFDGTAPEHQTSRSHES